MQPAQPQPSGRSAATALEIRVPLSKSLIWQAQEKFYAQRGIKAWTEDRVPEFITNNPFIADAYARIVFAFLQDCRASDGAVHPPVRILELGAGTGKFAYLFLRRLTQLLKQHDVPLGSFRYRMTDRVKSLLEWWSGNRYLQEFVARGNLEFECLPLDADGSHHEGISGPLVVIANYVFDSLPQDAFVVRNGKLSEVVVTTFTDGPHGAETPISELKRSFETIDVPADRYPETWWNDILSHYQRRSVAADILFPTAALGAVRDLARGSDTMLLLAGDKGFTDEAGFPAASGEPAFEFHAPNCFSQMVNFDAIGKYFEAKGGTALLPEKNLAGFGTCAFLRGRPCDRFGSTQRCYTDLQAGFGVDDLFAVMAWLNPHIEEMSLAQTLAVLRLSHWDTMTFLRVFPVLVRQARLAGVEREEIRTAVARVYSNYFPVSADSALAFHCGVLLLEMHFYEEALETFEISTREMGPSAATSYNMGLCHAGAGRRPKALECMDEACDLDPSFEPAKLARKNLGNETR